MTEPTPSPAPKPRWDTPRNPPAAGDDQRVFDTVVGPNMRLRDNLIQLAVIVAGTALGAGVGALLARPNGGDPRFGAFLGGFAGLLLALFLSGAVIGLVRFMIAVRSK